MNFNGSFSFVRFVLTFYRLLDMFYVELNGSGVKNSGFFILESVMVLSVVKCTHKYCSNDQDNFSVGSYRENEVSLHQFNLEKKQMQS